MKQRVYLDTSVLSALHDTRTPERMALTITFWSRLDEFEAATCELTRREIERTPDQTRREQMLVSLQEINVFPLPSESDDLARKYLQAGIFAQSQKSDALHVAAAVLTRYDVLVSWNFKHLVNRRRRAAVNSLNVSLGVPRIDIISPPEM